MERRPTRFALGQLEEGALSQSPAGGPTGLHSFGLRWLFSENVSDEEGHFGNGPATA